MPKDPVRVACGRIGGLTRSARYGGEAVSAAGRRAFLKNFELEVDPDGVLDPAERAKRADAALRAHMARLALKSVMSRKKAREAKAS